MSGYEQLVQLAERELEAVRDGRFDDLPEIDFARRSVLAGLPQQPPAAARAALERARDAQAELISLLAAAREATGRELARVRQGRGAVRAYGHLAAAATGGSADRRA
jgi:hypothetical protein